MSKASREIPWLDTRDGAYYVFWYDKELRRTNRFSLRTKDPVEARAAYVNFLTEGKKLFQTTGSDLKVGLALDQYLKEHVEVKCAAPERQRFAIDALKRHLGETAIASVDIPTCREYVKARQSMEEATKKMLPDKSVVFVPISLSTIRRELVVLRAAANHALSWKRLTAAEAPTFELPEEGQSMKDVHTKVELVDLLSKATGEMKCFINITYHLGSRRGAIENLEIDQVDFKNKKVHLAKMGERVTKKRRPTVPLYPEIEKDLVWLVSNAVMEGRTRLFSVKRMYVPYRKFCEKNGFGHLRKPHTLRHSRASLMLQDDVSPFHVARLLGDTMDTVDKTYAHHSPEKLGKVEGGKL
jgi:integrase